VSTPDYIPSTGFFPAYLRYARTQTDAPDLFHVGTALAMFSAAAAKDTTLAFPGCAPVPLHLWVLLVGPSGGRKSTAIRVGERVMASVFAGERVTASPLFVMALSRSPEATFDMLSKFPHGLLLHPEASNFFAGLRKPWWGYAEGLLTELYDGRTMKRVLPRKRTKRNPNPPPVEIVIKEPRVAFLGGICPDLLAATVRDKDRIGGSLGRMLPLYAECTWFKEIPSKPSKGIEKRLHLQFLWRASGPWHVSLSTNAMEHYKAWGRKTDYEAYNYAPDKRSMVIRLPQHILRVAALYRMSTSDENDEQVMDKAIALGEVAKMSILKLPPVGHH
jgi:hypothetical protein